MAYWQMIVSGWLDRVAEFSARWSIPMLRWSMGIVFLWFGALKLVGESPVADLVGKMSDGLPKRPALRFLGIWESALGVSMLTRLGLPISLPLLFAQQLGTFAVFLFRPREAYRGGNPFRLTDTGEFIVKNLVLLSAGLVMLGTVGPSRPKTVSATEDMALRREKVCL